MMKSLFQSSTKKTRDRYMVREYDVLRKKEKFDKLLKKHLEDSKKGNLNPHNLALQAEKINDAHIELQSTIKEYESENKKPDEPEEKGPEHVESMCSHPTQDLQYLASGRFFCPHCKDFLEKGKIYDGGYA